MKRMRTPTRLRLLFVAAVLVPCLILGLIALRSLDREEDLIALRLRRTLDAELVHTVSVINAELDRVQDELAISAPAGASASPEPSFAAWKTGSELVRAPFLLSPVLEIVWPAPGPSLSEDERTFLKWNSDFVTDRLPVPFYQNIALVYKDEISKLEAAPREEGEAAPGRGRETAAAEADAEKKAEPPAAGRSREGLASPSAAKSAPPASASRLKEAQDEQRALTRFEADPGLRQQVYDQAKALGQQTEQRTVAPSGGLAGKEPPAPRESIFISEPLLFSEITASAERGLIPRFVGDRLTLLFWSRDAAGGFVGCLIDDDAVRSRLAKLLTAVHTPARILTILDENGRPLLTAENGEARDWRRPFAAREISARLPRWEVAAYLTDPDAIAAQAGATTVIMGVLLVLLFAAIAGGGAYILHALRSEMLLARQKTTFVANVSHELKTPLTSIRMFAEMLKQGRQPDPSKREKYLDLMVSETERLTRLINNVLDFTRVERGRREYRKRRLDAALLCEELVEGQRVRLEHNGFAVAFRNEMGEAFIEGDEEALKQAVLNLLSNAEKYSGDDKRIEVEVGAAEGAVLIQVKDRGRGVPAVDAKRIFEEFYRVDDSLTARVGGSGLGLPIALRIVRDHGGDIRHYPRDGGGCIFQIRLPLEGRT